MIRRHLNIYVLAVACLAAAPAGDFDGSRIDTESDSYRQGVREAEADLKNEKATVYCYGFPFSAPPWDRKTGLKNRFIAGCVIDKEIVGRAAGYNRTVAAHVEAHGVPKYSMLPWLEELSNGTAFWNAHAGGDAVSVVNAVANSADGKHRVELRQQYKVPRNVALTWQLSITTDAGVVKTTLALPQLKTAELVWGPAGSNTVMLRFEYADGVHFHLFDLRDGHRHYDQPLRKAPAKPATTQPIATR